MRLRWSRGWAFALVLVSVFASALVVRVLYRIDREPRFDELMPYQSFISHRRAEKIVGGEGILLGDDADPKLLKQIRRPPGYPAFLAGIYLFTGPDLHKAQVVQIVLDSIVAALVAAIGMWLVSDLAGLAAGLLYAFSPHLSVFAGTVTPDAVASWPVLLGVALFIAALRVSDWRAYAIAAAAGVFIGLSCWLTAQGLTLPVVMLGAGVLVAKAGQRRRALAIGFAMAVAVLAIVGPLTVRNVVIYEAMVPVRPGIGATLLEGLGVYDSSLPATDGELLADEVQRYGRPDYERALYNPDGLAREQDRMHRALAVIAGRPIWFVRIMFDRMGLMATYEYAGDLKWPDDTAYVHSVERGTGGKIQRASRVTVIGVHWLVYRSWLIWILIAAGVAWLVRSGQWRLAVLLSIVPVHHMLLQSLLLTEYKYTLPIHAWLFVLAGTALCWLQPQANAD